MTSLPYTIHHSVNNGSLQQRSWVWLKVCMSRRDITGSSLWESFWIKVSRTKCQHVAAESQPYAANFSVPSTIYGKHAAVSVVANRVLINQNNTNEHVILQLDIIPKCSDVWHQHSTNFIHAPWRYRSPKLARFLRYSCNMVKIAAGKVQGGRPWSLGSIMTSIKGLTV